MQKSEYFGAACSAPSGAGDFNTTHWSVVQLAGADDSPQAMAALEALCRSYWYPLYAYIRRQGRGPQDAQDLTQEFFARLLERSYLRLADRSQGRFRTFLLSSLKNFLINDWKKQNREKRGGGRQIVSLDTQTTETRLLSEPVDDSSPDKAFDRRWALVLLDRVLDQLEREVAMTQRAHIFEELKCYLRGDGEEVSYAEVGSRLGMSESNLKVTVHRLRARYRELLRAEIGRTVESPEAIDEEIRHLAATLAD